LAARRAPVLGVVIVSQAVGLTLALVIALLRGEPPPGPADLAWAAAGGLAGGIGIASLYHGLATGRVAVVAPIAGVLAAALPVLVGAALQGLPGAARMAGVRLAIVAVVLVSVSADPAGGRQSGVRFGLLAGLGFGLFNVFASRFSAGIVFGPLVVVRGVEAALIGGLVVATRWRGSGRAWRVPRGVVPLAMAVGVGDMAGNAFFILAAQAGRLDVAAVLSSMYPVTTIVLATVLLHERMSRVQLGGVAVAASAIALIAAG
jgi:drug/metabolite transporter (DMT)-like permease